MQKKNAEEILAAVIPLLLTYVEELFAYKDRAGEQFQYGERVAYTECLEWLQCWEKANEHGLNFEIERRFPL